MRLPLFLLAATLATAPALMMSHKTGTWPKNWGEALEPLRKQAITAEWATGTQEDHHQIQFDTAADFDKYWPLLAKLLKPGAQLTLTAPGKAEMGTAKKAVSGARVFVLAPSASVAFDEKGKQNFHTGYQWPKSVYLPDGSLPEYVGYDGNGEGRQLMPLLDREAHQGFQYRARIDITLVCDGEVIDLNRFRFPAGVTVVDQR